MNEHFRNYRRATAVAAPSDLASEVARRIAALSLDSIPASKVFLLTLSAAGLSAVAAFAITMLVASPAMESGPAGPPELTLFTN